MKTYKILSKHKGKITVQEKDICYDDIVVVTEKKYNLLKRLFGDDIRFIDEIEGEEAKDDGLDVEGDLDEEEEVLASEESDKEKKKTKKEIISELDELGISYNKNARIEKLREILENNK